MKHARIEFLKDTFGNDKGDIVIVGGETDGEVYYNDKFGRWVYLEKTKEGITYRYIPAGTRLNNKKEKANG